MLNKIEAGAFLEFCKNRGMEESDKSSAAQAIIRAVRETGDKALLEFTARFDGADRSEIAVTINERNQIAALANPETIAAFLQALPNIRRFHEREKPTDWRINSGQSSWLGKMWKPLRRVGVYIPGGQAAYPSSVLMNLVPAQVAGVSEIAVCTPPGRDGKISPQVASLCAELGVDEIYAVGGAQAIAALAYGTESIPAVDKITGPGNAWVAEAKRQIFGKVGIDSLAGPSECMIIADETCNPVLAAIDLLAQAEHDSDARVVLICTSQSVAERIYPEIRKQLKNQPRKTIIEKAMKSAQLVIVSNMEEAVQCANAYAPEHLQIMTDAAEAVAEKIGTAGTVFLGNATPTALGDYFCGTNHVLPTGGAARYASGLSVLDFMRQQNVVNYSAGDTATSVETVILMAESEGLFAHAESMRLRKATRDTSEKLTALRYFRPQVSGSAAYNSSMSAGKTEAARNELYLDYDQKLRRAITEKLESIRFNRYPDASYSEVRQLLARKLGVEADMILPGSGSNELNLAVISSVIAPGCRLLTVTPGYFSYLRTAEMNGGVGLAVPLDENFEYPQQDFLKKLNEVQPELTVLARPNNPTGTGMPVEDVRRICEISSGLVLIDEAYVEFANDSVLPLLAEHENLIITRTFSKARGSAGMRFGYAIAAPEIIHELQKVLLPYNLSSLTAAVAATVLEKDWPGDKVIAEICGERERLRSAIKDIKNIRTFSSAANFLLVETVFNAGRLKPLFTEAGIQVRFFENEPRLNSCFRYSMQGREANDRFLRSLISISKRSGE